ncbi:MAG: restriction endonuclease subunit S [Oscillospiraceae bacterium]|nr:restriction endonuclease subunit S [Oscillospiraceae bacterium]
MARLDEICLLNMGQSPDSSTYNEDGEGMPFFQGNADFGEINPKIRVWCTEPTKIANVGDILISVRAPIGALNIANTKCCIGRGLAALTVREDLCVKEYLWHAIKSKVDELNSKGTGSTFKAINKNILAETNVPLYSLKEQKEIANIFDKMDELISCRKEQLLKLDELVKARFVEMFGDPENNKSGLIKIGEIGALTSGGTPSRTKPEYFKGDIRWYSAGELNSLYLPDSVEHISETALQQSSAKLFNKGTLMIGMYDTAAFKMGILTENSSSNQACANLNPNPEYNIIWLYYLFDIMKPVFLQERQGVRQKNLSLSKIREFEVPFAPFELQNQFAAFVEQTEKTKAEVQKSLDELEILKKSLMQKYFG